MCGSRDSIVASFVIHISSPLVSSSEIKCITYINTYICVYIYYLHFLDFLFALLVEWGQYLISGKTEMVINKKKSN